MAERPSQQTWSQGPVAPIPLANTGAHKSLQVSGVWLRSRGRAAVGFLGIPWGCLDFLMTSGFERTLLTAYHALTSTQTSYPRSQWGSGLWALRRPPELKLEHICRHWVSAPHRFYSEIGGSLQILLHLLWVGGRAPGQLSSSGNC